jgi:hypothetical protein
MTTSEQITKRNARELAVIEALEKHFGYERRGDFSVSLLDPKKKFVLRFNAYEKEKYKFQSPVYVRVKADPGSYFYGRKEPWILITEKEDTPEKIVAKYERDLLPQIIEQQKRAKEYDDARKQQVREKAEAEVVQAQLMVDVNEMLIENDLTTSVVNDSTFTFSDESNREFVLQPFKDSVVLRLRGITLNEAIEIIKQYGPNGRREP